MFSSGGQGLSLGGPNQIVQVQQGCCGCGKSGAGQKPARASRRIPTSGGGRARKARGTPCTGLGMSFGAQPPICGLLGGAVPADGPPPLDVPPYVPVDNPGDLVPGNLVVHPNQTGVPIPQCTGPECQGPPRDKVPVLMRDPRTGVLQRTMVPEPRQPGPGPRGGVVVQVDRFGREVGRHLVAPAEPRQWRRAKLAPGVPPWQRQDQVDHGRLGPRSPGGGGGGGGPSSWNYGKATVRG